jgi:uncharacterized protein YkuJ
MITQEELKEILEYNPDTGVLKWNKTLRNGVQKGREVSGLDKDGYLRVKYNGKTYMAHRLAWLYVYGEYPNIIDHIDRDVTNNRIENLRNVDNYTNRKNQKVFKNNTSKVTGVCYVKNENKWMARISENGKRILLGKFENKEDAIKARFEAEEKLGYTSEKLMEVA